MAKKGIYQRYSVGTTTKKQYFWNFTRSGVSGGWSSAYLDHYIDPDTGRTELRYLTSAYNLDIGQQVWNTQSTTWRLNIESKSSDGETVGGTVFTGTISIRDVAIDVKGTYLNDIIADYGTLPADGKHTDGYWYVFVKMASDLKVNVGGIWRDAPTAYVNVGGIMRPQSELKANVGGIWR